MVAPLVLVWLVLTLMLGVVFGAIVLVQYSVSRLRPVSRLGDDAAARPEQPAAATSSQAA